MIDVEARLDELNALGLQRRTRLVSGPQGPHVVLDGKPALVLCSNNYLGFADHPRVREAAADAAIRWGAGAGAPRLACGTMTIHRRLEDRLAEFCRRESALLFGSGQLAATGTIPALARAGDVVFSDELNAAATVDGCRLSRAEVFVYDHCDVDHLAWGIERAEGRGALVVTDSVFGLDGDIAPLPEIVELAHRGGLRTVVDEAHAIGALGARGQGALAISGLEDQVDVIVGALDNALASSGAFVACDRRMARYLVNVAKTFLLPVALPPPTVAAALASLELLESKPHRLTKLAANTAALRTGLEREGFDVGDSRTQILPVHVGDGRLAARMSEAALVQGVFTQAIGPPAVPPESSRLRLTAMATHSREELLLAARTLGAAARLVGFEPRLAPSGGHDEVDVPGAGGAAQTGVFDVDAPRRARRAA
ncbi:MAG: aminotransferase class I/II-fold pyridoxal phosphate-dependent enzyme [Solirubrobacteraceae bacterium]